MSYLNPDTPVVFGIGFRIGFLVAVVGLIMSYMQLLDITVSSMMDFTGFWPKFNVLPSWIKLALTGLMLMGAAIATGTLKDLVEAMIEGLLGRD